MGKTPDVARAPSEALIRLRAVATALQDACAPLPCLAEYGDPCINGGRACACGRVWHPEIDDVEPGNITERCRECNQRLAPQARRECAACKHARMAEEALAWLDTLGGADRPGTPRRSQI